MALEGHYEVRTIVTRSPLQTIAEKKPEGLQLDLIVLVGGEAECHRFTIGEQGVKAIQDALFGIVIPDAPPPPEDL